MNTVPRGSGPISFCEVGSIQVTGFCSAPGSLLRSRALLQGPAPQPRTLTTTAASCRACDRSGPT